MERNNKSSHGCGHTRSRTRAILETGLIGTIAIYKTQAKASRGIPQQWRASLQAHPGLQNSSNLYVASLCTGDRKIHDLTGIAQKSPENVAGEEHPTIEAGDYADVRVEDAALLRDTWTWFAGPLAGDLRTPREERARV